MLFDHGFTLLHCQASEREHADLGSDVRPVTLDTLSFNGVSQGIAHVVHTLRHSNELVEPLLAHGRLGQNGSCDSSTVLRWRRVVAAHDDLDLGEHLGGRVLVSAYKVKTAGSLTVQAHDLSEGLGNHHFETLGEEKAQAVGILIEGTRGEALIGRVEEGEKLATLADVGDLLPLGISWVNTSRVVRTGVEEHSGAGLGRIKISNHATDIKTLCLLVEVAVLADLNASRLEHLVMVAPGRVAHVEGSWAVLREELSNDAKGTRA